MRSLPTMCAVAVVMASVFAGQAAEFHVQGSAPHASDEQPGTLEAPWKTVSHAAKVAQPGDTVWIHRGVYHEAVTAMPPPTATVVLTFAAYGEDAVMFDGADVFPASRWTRAEGFSNIWVTALDADPGCVFVDEKPLFMKVRRLARDKWQFEPLTDADENTWHFDETRQELSLNLGGRTPEQHQIAIPVRRSAFLLGRHLVLRGIQARRYSGRAISVGGEEARVEDCVVSQSRSGIGVHGWEVRNVRILRNTVHDCLDNGIHLSDRPLHTRVLDNLIVRCTLNPWHTALWSGGIKMNSAEDSLIAHNVVLEMGHPDTVDGWDGWALWGDINVTRVAFIGNSTAHNKEAGIYVEHSMGDTRAYFNVSKQDGHGLTCRASQRGLFLHNYIESPKTSGLAIWRAVLPYPTVDNVFAHNLVRNANPSLRFQVEQPIFCNYNTCWPRAGTPLADGDQRTFQTLEDLRSETGHERDGEVADRMPPDLGLDLVTFRVAMARDPDEIFSMIGNQGCEWEDPYGINLLPYFWRPGTGDGIDRVFRYAAYTSLPGGIDAFAYSGGGATIALRADTNIVRTGVFCLEVGGHEPERMPSQGSGFWSPCLPARPGDEIRISLWAKALDLKADGEGQALCFFADFDSPTGQQRQRVDLLAGQKDPTSKLKEWAKIESVVRVPETARRVRFFFGLRPATGTLWLDDISIALAK